jgi:Putative transposase
MCKTLVRRFVQHVLPRGFVKVRHYGLLSNRNREQKLVLCRWLLLLLGACLAAGASGGARAEAGVWLCPDCGQGKLVIVQRLPPGCATEQTEPGIEDSS